jgi:predicted  nucleic acid-binding Zn-ribbon protein
VEAVDNRSAVLTCLFITSPQLVPGIRVDDDLLIDSMEDLVLTSLRRRQPVTPSTGAQLDTISYAPSLSHEVAPQCLPSNGPLANEKMERRTDVPIERPESPLSSLGHIGLVRNQRNALHAELRSHEDAAIEAKRSISSLRKLALRLAVRISVREAHIASHARSLARSRMSQYLAERGTSPSAELEKKLPQSENFPLSPPQSPGPNKPLPSLPRWDSSGRVPLVRFSPVVQPDLRHLLHQRHQSAEKWQAAEKYPDVLIRNDEQMFEKMDASRASLVKELDATQAKLAKLFESQAMLRERYNAEKEKARNLGTECQETQEKVFNLEQSKHEVEEETRQLHQRIHELEQGNQHLRDELGAAKDGRTNIQEDLSKLRSSKLTLEHQLQALSGSKGILETQMEQLRTQMEAKVAELERGTAESTTSITLLESEKIKLADDLRVTKFKLTAAEDLESKLQSNLSGMREHEATLEQALLTSREVVSKLELELHDAKSKLGAMEETVSTLTAKLEVAERSREKLEEITRLARESKERSDAQLRKDRKGKSKTVGRLRSARSLLFASEANKRRVETELSATQTDLELVQKSNWELKELVEKTENRLNEVVVKTTNSVEQLEAVMSGQRLQIPNHDLKKYETIKDGSKCRQL